MPRFQTNSDKWTSAYLTPAIAPCEAHPHVPEVNPVNPIPTNTNHAAHAPGNATSREGAPDGDTEAPSPAERDTAQRVAHGLVEPGASHRLPTVTDPRPRCPQCGHIRLRKYRSITDQGDGTALSWVKCQNAVCGHRFRLLLE